MSIDTDLVKHLINFNLQPAITYFEQTNDQTKLEQEIEFCIKQITVCKDTDTLETLKKLKNSLIFESEIRKEKTGLLKAIEILEAKHDFQGVRNV